MPPWRRLRRRTGSRDETPTRTVNAFAALQHALPKRAISRALGAVARSERRLLAQPLIHAFARAFAVDLSEAAPSRAGHYRSFNAFFTRALAPGARPLPADPAAIASPADGRLTEFGPVAGGRLIQAKGHHFSLAALLADAEVAEQYTGGTFCIIYLAPRDYHRVHAPAAGRLIGTVEVPGSAFAVNARTASAVPGLFARNERLVCLFDRFALVMVGALIVRSIETVWRGPASPDRGHRARAADQLFERGAELGRFLLGSTVVVLFPPGAMRLAPHLTRGMAVRMGQALGALTNPRRTRQA